MNRESLKAAAKRAAETAAEGLTHGERESLALDLAAVAAGEEVAFLKCGRSGLVGWMNEPGPDEPLDERERAEVQEKMAQAGRGGLDPAGQKRLLWLLDRSEKARGGTVSLTAAERRRRRPEGDLTAEEAKVVRACGLSPESMIRRERERGSAA